jgi:hypothetical protein
VAWFVQMAVQNQSLESFTQDPWRCILAVLTLS